MQLATIDIQKQDAYIGLNSHRPGLQLKQEHADMHIDQQLSAILEISTTASKLFIDQTEAFADANLKTSLRMASEFFSRSNAVVSQYVAKTAQQGEQLKRIENGTGALAQIAKVNSQIPEKEVTLGYMPKSMSQVKFDYQPASLSVRAPYKEVDVNVNRRPPQIEIPKWQTETYVQQKNQISFQAVGGNVNMGL
ncbi:DUF6470 family protein [Halalkalibacter alkaliphilus]|uniref:DUF6470 family protein n=1 Tax=Halalkalibacter alkaliphilus TaxID=2917993 RepID=A0A9X2A4J0_9BACI|nr:DUF6470 family protein [Halalkalibacter alkaliphilus]MCL7746738.1 DUF6470 family protein [Halalkalibacter alkaliphilus]